MNAQVILDDRSAYPRKVNLDDVHTVLTLGAGSYLLDGIVSSDTNDVHVLVGQYTTIGRRITFDMGARQPEDGGATYAFDDLAAHGNLSEYARCRMRRQVIIGSDVWIGNDVTIVGGVYIGSGAVIKSGSVVTGDVPAYAVVSGKPMRVTHYRFDADTITRLLETRWWNWPEERILENVELLQSSPKLFAEKFSVPEDDTEQTADETVQALAALKEEGYRIYYFVPDFEAPEAIWQKVFREYLSAYGAEDKTVLVLDISAQEDIAPQMDELSGMLDLLGDAAPAVVSHAYTEDVSRELLRHADCFITTKEDISSRCIDYAAAAGIEIRCGLDYAERLFPTDKTYDVTVGVGTYCSDYDKLYTTLVSIISQQGCSIELIIGDDGTPDFRVEEVTHWLLERQVKNFKIICSPENKGTVHNAFNILTAAHGDYVKLISPGDYLYSDNVLCDMLSFMKSEGYRVAFGRACYYHKENEQYQILDTMNPLDLEPYEKKDFAAIKKAYMLYGDFIVGAGFICERKLVTVYTRSIIDTVIYGEDSVYAMMIADDIQIGFWNQNLIWYEYWNGISTGSSEKLRQKLSKDSRMNFALISVKHGDIHAARERLLTDNPGKTMRDIRSDYVSGINRRNQKEQRSYLKDVDIRELEKLVHADVTFVV